MQSISLFWQNICLGQSNVIRKESVLPKWFNNYKLSSSFLLLTILCLVHQATRPKRGIQQQIEGIGR